jgi:hypothetical protein
MDWGLSLIIRGMIYYNKLNIKNLLYGNILSKFSILLILITAIVLDENGLYPRFWALIPSLSAMLIIVGGP